jgi:hypothetical protein
MLYREVIAVCSEIHAKHIKRKVGRTQNFLMLQLMVHKVSLRLKGTDDLQRETSAGGPTVLRSKLNW